MKTLLILRHGKSSWGDPEVSDHDRPLKARGKRDAPCVGKLLGKQNMVPDFIVSSTAERALRTAELVAESCGYTGETRYTETLYYGSLDDFTKVLNEVADDCDSVMIVGHNPGFEELLRTLTGRGERMPTAALARVVLPIASWKELTLKTQGILESIWRPKELE